jgi:hypothetical protein
MSLIFFVCSKADNVTPPDAKLTSAILAVHKNWPFAFDQERA